MKEVLDFALSLQRATKAFLLYGSSSHPRAREAVEGLIDHTEALLLHDRVQIISSRGSLFVNGQVIALHNQAIDWLIEELSERQLNGFVINKGVSAAEISQLVRIFSLKAPQLESAGGAASLLAEVESTHVRLSQTRYEEVRDGEIVIHASEKVAPGVATADGFDPTAALETLARGAALGEGEADRLAAVVAEWMKRRAEGAARADETSPSGVDPELPSVENLADVVRSDTAEAALIQRRLKELGISRSQLDEILEVVAWENLDVDERMRRSLDGSLIFELPAEKSLAFTFDLVRTGRLEDAARLTEKLASGLFLPNPEHRKVAAAGLQRIAGWIVDPGLPPAIEALVEKQLLTHFVRETDPQIQRRSQIAFMRLYDTWILRGQLGKALQTLRKLESVAAAAAAANPWKQGLYEELLDRLINKERATELLDLMHAQDLDTMARDYHPLLAFFKGRAAVRLLEALESEQDRTKRGRLIKAIKGIGKPAQQHLELALKSPTWYLVRNALNVLGDLTAVEFIEPMGTALSHEDERVRRAAARALGKIGGMRVERFLVDAMKANSGETQIEILSVLASLKAESAVDALIEMIRSRRMGHAEDPERLKAIETIGAIGAAKGVAPLVELVRRKSVLGGLEPPAVRKAAALALVAIGSLESFKEAQAIAESDPDPALRAELSKALWH
jgi:HEAT repeat protein